MRKRLKKKTKLKNTIYYWAYGSNLNVKAMESRCPGAEKLVALPINNGALVFRGVADAIYREGSVILGGLWLINSQHEATLDAYEGVRVGLYNKCYFKLLVDGKEVRCLYYQMNLDGPMNIRGIYPPSDSYADCIMEGYQDFGLPLEALDKAIHESWRKKKPTEYLIERHKRRGGNLVRPYLKLVS